MCKPSFFVPLYILVAITTFGWNWHRDCYVRGAWANTREYIGSTVCSGATGAFWPVYWAFRGAVIVLDPAHMPKITIE